MIKLLFFLVSIVVMQSCTQSYVPKPKAYPKINFPDKNYIVFSDNCPFEFEVPDYAQIAKESNDCWQNIHFEPFNATLFLSYFSLNNQNTLAELSEDSRALVFKHSVKASSINEVLVNNEKVNVFGKVYFIGGNTASSLQFYLTDSTNHFLRAALYFNSEPNIDSIRPVLEYINKDVEHLINTIQWKNK